MDPEQVRELRHELRESAARLRAHVSELEASTSALCAAPGVRNSRLKPRNGRGKQTRLVD
jgi:hypothetical protein